jgi:hypothetical protein
MLGISSESSKRDVLDDIDSVFRDSDQLKGRSYSNDATKSELPKKFKKRG